MNEVERIEKKGKNLQGIFMIALLVQVAYFLFVVVVGIPVGPIEKDLLVPLQAATVLYTLGIIPLSLKLFQVMCAKIDPSLPLKQRLERYSSLYIFRLLAIGSIPVMNESLFLFSGNKSELMMALIGGLALAFCMTSAQRIKIELNIMGDESAES
ncbi:MAG TPA: hypothetical protein VIK42_06605 [Bacteroidales bacterium]